MKFLWSERVYNVIDDVTIAKFTDTGNHFTLPAVGESYYLFLHLSNYICVEEKIRGMVQMNNYTRKTEGLFIVQKSGQL